MRKTLVILALLMLSPFAYADPIDMGAVTCTVGDQNCTNATVRQTFAAAYVAIQTGCVQFEPACASIQGNTYTVTVIEKGANQNGPQYHKCEDYHYKYEIGAFPITDPFTGAQGVSWAAGGNPEMTKHASGNPGCETVIGFTMTMCVPWSWNSAYTYPSASAAFSAGEGYLSVKSFQFGETVSPYSGEGVCHDQSVEGSH